MEDVPTSFATEPLELTLGSHSETLSFIVAPGMEWPLILVLTWLKKIESEDRLAGRELKFPQRTNTPT